MGKLIRLTGAFETKEYILSHTYLNEGALRKIARDENGITRITVGVMRPSYSPFGRPAEEHDILLVTETPAEVLAKIEAAEGAVASDERVEELEAQLEAASREIERRSQEVPPLDVDRLLATAHRVLKMKSTTEAAYASTHANVAASALMAYLSHGSRDLAEPYAITL